MAKLSKAIGKTERILSIYHLLTFCKEVSYQELMDNLPGSRKTFQRDIMLLIDTGLPIRYKRQWVEGIPRKVFVLESPERVDPDYPDSLAGVRQLDRIIRLTKIMDDIPPEDPDIWYRETFPKASQRTMQRDFATLNSIGYRIMYEREECNSHDAGFDVPPGHYYCDSPHGTYSLTPFGKAGASREKV